VSFWQFLNHWWNLPYLVMLGLVGVFFVLQTVGLVSHGGSHEHDHDVDHDHDVEHDHDLDHHHDVDHDHDAPGALGGLLAFLGLGRVPFMVVWLTLFIFAGFTGLLLNRILFVKTDGQYPAWSFPLSLLASLAVGVVATGVASRGVAKLVDVGGRGSARKKELAGRAGVVASPRVDDQFGEVRVRDGRGQEMIVHARVQPGEAPPRQGDHVVLLEFDEKSELFLVARQDKE